MLGSRFCLFLVFLVAVPSLARAGEMDVLLNILQAKGVLNATEVEQVRSEVKEVMSQKSSSDAIQDGQVAAWVQSIKLSGDMRLRHEYLDRTGDVDSNRERIRFRLGMQAKVTDELEVGARFATGSLTNPRSTNQTLDDTFTSKSFNVDHAYVAYSPELFFVDQFKVIGGLMGNPFWRSYLFMWDGDISFAGVAAKAAQKVGRVDVFANAGLFPVDSDGFGTDTPALWSVQGGASFMPFEESDLEVLENLKILGALDYHDYRNSVKNALINTGSGNTASAEDFNQLSPGFLVSTKVWKVPVKLNAHYVNNTASSSDDEGYQVGFKIGQAKKPWSLSEGLEVGYLYQRLEANSVFDGVADADFIGGTNGKGGYWFVKLATLKNSSLKIGIFDVEEVNGAKDHRDTVQIDWVTKF